MESTKAQQYYKKCRSVMGKIHLYKHFYNTIDANATSWSLTFPKFNYGNETNWLTADHRGGQGIKRPFQEKHNSSSSSKSALENPPPLIQWGTPEYGSLRKNIIDKVLQIIDYFSYFLS